MKTIGSSCVGSGGSSLPVCAQVAGEADLRTKVPAAVGAGDGARSLGPRGIFLPLLPSSLGRDDCCGLVLCGEIVIVRRLFLFHVYLCLSSMCVADLMSVKA